MLWPFMAQVLAVVLTEEHAGRLRESRLANVLRVRPAGRSVVVTRRACRERQTDIAMATATATMPLLPAMAPPVSKISGV
ncbi:Uncharacterised protein [Salmonella enterica subsp. enterica]|uniref:Uncharacterized protein n=1 Tax=Salmonella enterica I TaxID=59201 RepID=A0A379W4C9_SALET|nr:Uncharacterised protein [Salmonella enterica subsp. enterica]